MKIIFMGSPEFSVPTLKLLNESKHQISVCYTMPKRKSGRGQKLQAGAIYKFAEQKEILIHTPLSLRDKNQVKIIESYNPDLIVVVAYNHILPTEILNIPKFGCLNLHPSLLPRWRGAAPLQRTILSGDKKTAVCIIKMDEGLDSGDILKKQEIDLTEKMNLGDLHDITSAMGAKMILELVNDYEKGNDILPIKQSDMNEKVTYAKKISKDELSLDWNLNVVDICNKIRGFSPFPKAYFMHNNEIIKILKADYQLIEHEQKIGKIFFEKDKLIIVAGDGYIFPQILQRESRKALEISEFLKGFNFSINSIKDK